MRVAAAASLRDALTAAAGQGALPAAELSFAGSQAIAAQAIAGAPLDVVITADEVTLNRLLEADVVDGAPRPFARNRLAVIVSDAGGGARLVRRLADLARPDVRVVLADPAVPVGRLAAVALARAGVIVHPASLEQSVAGVVTKVALGEADAGIAYITDLGHDDLGGFAVADPTAVTTYHAVVLRSAGDRAAARRFVDALQGAATQRALAASGFLAP